MLTSLVAGLPRPIARVVHFGAGAGAELAGYLEAGAAAVLLVEAHGDTAAELAARVAEDPRVEVLQAAVSGDPQPRPFHRTSLPELDSLRPPAAGLRELFPGLRRLAEETVAPVDPAVLLRDRPAATEGTQLLVLETPGEALSILEALAAADLLQGFAAVALREARTPLYEGAPPLDRIRDCLEAAWFRTEIEPAPEDPERPWLLARLNRAAMQARREAEALRGERDGALETLRQREAEREAEREAAQAQIAALTGERDGALETLRQREAEREAEREAAQTQIAALTGERDGALETLRQREAEREAEREAAQAQIAALTGERDGALETLRQREAEREAEREAAQAQIAALTGERDGALETLRQREAEREAEREAAQAQIAALTGERDGALETLRQREAEREAEREAAQTQIAALTGERDELRAAAERRSRQGHDEILKAEGQIRLLWDLLAGRDTP